MAAVRYKSLISKKLLKLSTLSQTKEHLGFVLEFKSDQSFKYTKIIRAQWKFKKTMLKTKSVRRVQYQRWLINKDRELKCLQKFRKIRIILLETICELLINVQKKSKNNLTIEVIESLKQCRNWLASCLESLKIPNHNLFIYGTILSRYVDSIEKLIIDFKKKQIIVRAIGQKRISSEIMNRELFENIWVIQIAIQMLELFMRTGKSFHFKSKGKKLISKRVQCLNYLQDNYEEDSPNQENNIMLGIKPMSENDHLKENNEEIERVPTSKKRQAGGKTSKGFRNSIEESETYLKSLQKYWAESFKNNTDTRKSEVGHSLHIKRSLENASPRMSILVSKIRTQTMHEIGSYIINALFAHKNSIRPILKPREDTISISSIYGEDIDIRNIWECILNEYNQFMLNSKNGHIANFKEDLVKSYLMKMQLLLHSQMIQGRDIDKRKRKSTASFKSRSFFQRFSKVETKPKENRFHNMNKVFYNTQLRKLKKTLKHMNIRQLYHIIMSDEGPKRETDHAMLRQYEEDPHHYNILLMLSSNDLYNRESLLLTIEQNFERVKNLLERKRRQQKMSLNLIQSNRVQKSLIANTVSIGMLCKKGSSWIHSLKCSSTIVINEDYCTVERAKWARYFADQEKSPTELYLEATRQQRKKDNSIQKKLDRRRRLWLERISRRGKRSITELYTDPRLTHRMRQAINQIAEEDRSPSKYQPHCPAANNTKTTVAAKEQPEHEEQKLPMIANALLESGSWTSCCSKCKNYQDDTAIDTALDRFFRTHDQIVALGKTACANFYTANKYK